MTTDRVTLPTDSFSETCSSVTNGIISFFLLVLVTVFPLVVHNSYFDILETKYMCFYLTVLIMLGVLLLAGLIMLFIDIKEFQGNTCQRALWQIKTKLLEIHLFHCGYGRFYFLAGFRLSQRCSRNTSMSLLWQ